MHWPNLKTMNCPACEGTLKDTGLGYSCQADAAEKCEFYISYEKFRDVINKMYNKKPRYYDADAVDRSSWD